ncbi:MAG: sulfite exporter TauE/SafE family protein [Hyphomicrobiaceae bacterium]
MIDIGVSASDAVLIIGALLAGGCLTGFLVGLLGVGGGGVMVPVLYEVFSVLDVDSSIRMQMSVGTALAVMVPTSLRSFYTHSRHGQVDTLILKRLVVPVVVGVCAGSVIAKFTHSDTLKWVWVVCSSLLAAKMLFGREDWRLGDAVPKSFWLEIYAVGIGTISSLMSVGGGAFMTVMMTLYGRTMQQAVATSSGFGPAVALPGMIGFVWAGWGHDRLPPLSLGYVSLLGAIIMISTSLMTAPIGARVAHGISRRALEMALGGFLTLVAIRFLFALYG